MVVMKVMRWDCGHFFFQGAPDVPAVRGFGSGALFQVRQRATGAGVPTRDDPPVAPASPLRSPPRPPHPVPLGRARPGRTGAPGAAYPGDDGGVPRGGLEQQRRQQQQEQQRGAARATHGALGPGRRLGGRWGRAGWSAERLAGGPASRASLPAAIKTSPAVTHTATRAAARAGATARAHLPRPPGPARVLTAHVLPRAPAPPPRAPRRQRPPQPSARARMAFVVGDTLLCCPGFPSSTCSAPQTCSSFALQMFKERLLHARRCGHTGGSKGGDKNRSIRSFLYVTYWLWFRP